MGKWDRRWIPRRRYNNRKYKDYDYEEPPPSPPSPHHSQSNPPGNCCFLDLVSGFLLILTQMNFWVLIKKNFSMFCVINCCLVWVGLLMWTFLCIMHHLNLKKSRIVFSLEFWVYDGKGCARLQRRLRVYSTDVIYRKWLWCLPFNGWFLSSCKFGVIGFVNIRLVMIIGIKFLLKKKKI